MASQLENLSGQVSTRKDPGNPPLHLWHPELSGDIDILIKADGTWIHEARPIERQSLVRLFASILRREDDGDYYLVTPVEKWRLRVEALPLIVTDFSVQGDAELQQITVLLNTDRQFLLGEEHPLIKPALSGELAQVPAVQLPHGLSALFSRNAWYRLADLCREYEQGQGVYSGGMFFPLV